MHAFYSPPTLSTLSLSFCVWGTLNLFFNKREIEKQNWCFAEQVDFLRGFVRNVNENFRVHTYNVLKKKSSKYIPLNIWTLG